MFRTTTRTPRAIVFINGTRVAFREIELNSNNFYQADTFRLRVPTKEMQPKEIDRNWWAEQDVMEVEIFIGEPPDANSYTEKSLGPSLIVGIVDSITDDLVRDEIELIGRDYTSKLIDTKTTIKWPNKRASAIARELADKYGLTADVTETTDKAGVLYERDHTKMSNFETEWNLLVWLAQQEGFQVFVEKKTLYFGPPIVNRIYNMKWEKATDEHGKAFKGAHLLCERNLSVAKDIVVTVSSYDYKKKQKIYGVYRASRSKDRITRHRQIEVGQPQTYSKNVPNITKEKCGKLAKEWAEQITRHQIKMAATGMPADNELSSRHVIRLTGTGAYDQDYHVDSIVRRFNLDDGYRMDVIAKNHDTNSEPEL